VDLRTYGHKHAALTAVVSRYRSRGAVREVGKALGLPEDITAALAGQIWGWSVEGVSEKHVAELNLDRSDPRLSLTIDLARQLIGRPATSASIRAASSSPATGSTISFRSSLRRWRIAESSNGKRTISRSWVHEGRRARPRNARLHAPRLRSAAEHKGQRSIWPRPRCRTDDTATFDMICKADTLGTSRSRAGRR
jgi:error-prone DNA polymerase